MKKFFLALVVFFTAITIQAEQITFMTYNLLTNTGLNFQSSRISKLSQIISASGSDIVALQEVCGNSNFDNLKSQTGMNGSWFDIGNFPLYGYGIGILWKSSLGAPTITNYKVPHREGSNDSEDRVFMVAEFNDFCFISTHFSLDAIDRDTITARIIRVANTLGKTVFIGGDFNASPNYHCMLTFQNNGFEILNNLNHLTYPSDNPTDLIDMILGFRKNPSYTGYMVLERGIPTPPAGISFSDASDHLPYYVKVELTAPEPQTLMVTSNSNDATVAGSLPWCIQNTSSGDTIKFNFNESEITLSNTSNIPEGKTLTVDGLNLYNHQKVILNGTIRSFDNAGNLTIKNLIIRDKTTSSIASSGTLTIENCEFINNQGGGDNGGAIRTSNGNCYVNNSIFDSNTAGGTYGGGAICAYNEGTNVEITSTSFINNKSLRGGAISIFKGADITVTNTTFANNEASFDGSDRRGGAIYCACPDNNTTEEIIYCTIINSTITGNQALNNGGGICAYGRTDQKKIYLNLINTILAYNIQGTPASYNDVYNWNNNVRVMITAKNCIFGTTNYTTYIDETSIVPQNIEESNIFDSLEIFVSDKKRPTLTDFQGKAPVALLSKNSIAINKGTTYMNGFAIPTTDQLGNSRPTPPSIGAVEYMVITDNILPKNQSLKVYYTGQGIVVEGLTKKCSVEIYDIMGKLLYKSIIAKQSFIPLNGIRSNNVIINIDNQSFKLICRP